MANKTIQAVLDAERAAREAEGIFDPTPEQMVALKRYRVLRARVERDKAEMEAIESAIFAQMEEVGAKALAVNGRNWALISDTHKTVVDTEGFKRDFPTLAAQYAEAIAKYTTRPLIPGGRKAVKPA